MEFKIFDFTAIILDLIPKRVYLPDPGWESRIKMQALWLGIKRRGISVGTSRICPVESSSQSYVKNKGYMGE